MLTQSFHCSKCDFLFSPCAASKHEVRQTLCCGHAQGAGFWRLSMRGLLVHLPCVGCWGKGHIHGSWSHVCLCRCTADMWVCFVSCCPLNLLVFRETWRSCGMWILVWQVESQKYLWRLLGSSPCAYPLFLDLELSKVFCSIHGHPCFSFKGTERICFVLRIKI